MNWESSFNTNATAHFTNCKCSGDTTTTAGNNHTLEVLDTSLVAFDDTNGNFDWSSIAGRIGDILGQTVGAVGSMLQSVSSTLFGEQSTLSQWFGDVTKNVAGEDNAEAGKKKVQAFANNLNKMWKDHVIQQTAMPSISGMKALLTGDPVGNWHMTVGNPLNPIMVVGNLICTKMQIEMDDELGPDDFPVNLKVTYTIEHGMPRDKAAI
jgi:hypothetical protein